MGMPTLDAMLMAWSLRTAPGHGPTGELDAAPRFSIVAWKRAAAAAATMKLRSLTAVTWPNVRV
jgi:hypothetical protein